MLQPYESQSNLLSNSAGSKQPSTSPIQTGSGQVHNALSYTEDRLGLLSNISSELEMRLSHVLSPAVPGGAAAGGSEKPASYAPITERIANINNVVDALISRVNYVIGRLEI